MVEMNNVEKLLMEYDNELNKLNDRIKRAIEYLTSYESISTIQGLDDIEKNKQLDEKTIDIMTNRYLEVHDKLLNILEGESNE